MNSFLWNFINTKKLGLGKYTIISKTSVSDNLYSINTMLVFKISLTFYIYTVLQSLWAIRHINIYFTPHIVTLAKQSYTIKTCATGISWNDFWTFGTGNEKWPSQFRTFGIRTGIEKQCSQPNRGKNYQWSKGKKLGTGMLSNACPSIPSLEKINQFQIHWQILHTGDKEYLGVCG